MLVDTLMHRCLFFSKTLYEKKVAPNDRQEFADQIFDDHNDAAAMSEFQDCWNNHVTFRTERKLPVAHGLRLVAGIGCGRASAAGEARPISSGLLRSMYDQQPQRSDQPGKSRLHPVCTVCAICRGRHGVLDPDARSATPPSLYAAPYCLRAPDSDARSATPPPPPPPHCPHPRCKVRNPAPRRRRYTVAAQSAPPTQFVTNPQTVCTVCAICAVVCTCYLLCAHLLHIYIIVS